MERPATNTLLAGDTAAVNPADGFAKRRPPATPAAPRAADLTGRPPRLREYLTALFVEGGGTITTAAGRTLVQPDGDLVVTLAHTSSTSRVDEWNQHLEQVATWLAGLRHRLKLIARGLGFVRLVVLGAFPLIAALSAWTAVAPPTGATSLVALAVGISAVVMALVTIVESSLSLRGSSSERATAGKSSTWWSRLRQSRQYAVVLAIAPASLAAWSALLNERPLAALIPILGLAMALAGMLAFRLALRRILK
jgi:hypothetical protein